MKNIQIVAQYPTVKVNNKDITYQTEKKWTGRPAWIKIICHREPKPRFLSIRVPKHGELIYKAFGHYYYPIDYTNDEERRFMDGMAEEYDEMVADTFNTPMAKTLLSRLPLKEINKDGYILDMGCGTGIMAELLAREGFSHFTLVDFSEGMLTQAKNKLARVQMANYESMDITKELPKGVFDVVVSVMLFNSFDNKTTDLILSRLVKQMPKKALFGIIEDTEKSAYSKHFQPVVSKMVDIGHRTKYIFIGIKK